MSARHQIQKKILAVTALSALVALAAPAVWPTNVAAEAEQPRSAELADINLAGKTRAEEAASPEIMTGVSGGGNHLRGYESLSITGGVVSGNSISVKNGAFAHGGGLAIDNAGRAILSGLTFSRNVATVEGAGQSTAFAAHGPSSGARGGALSIYNQGRAEPVFVPSELMKFSVDASTFSSNSAEADGPGALAAGGAVAVLGHVESEFDGSKVSGAMFAGNRAVAGPTSTGGAEGGAVLVAGNPFREQAGDLPPTVVFTKVAFEGNSAESLSLNNEHMDARGGAVSLSALNGKAVFRGCLFDGNQLKAVVAESPKGRGRTRGGAIFSDNGLVIENTVFKNNGGSTPGSALGGALEVGGAKSVIKNSAFEGNTAHGGSEKLGDKYNGPVAGFGGALYLNGQMTIADSTFAKNSATGLAARGGAIFVGRRAALTLVDTDFFDNMAIGAEASGGAIEVAAGGKLVIGVSEGKTMTLAGNKAGYSPDQARPSGIYLASPDPDQSAPPAPADGRPPRPETDDLTVNTAKEARLLLRDPLQGEKATIAKDGAGLFGLAGSNQAAAWKIEAGSLGFLADGQGRGARLKAGEELSFAKNTALVLEPTAGQPHVIEADALKLPPEFQIVVSGGELAPEKGIILKLTGGADLKGLSGRTYSGTMTVGQAVYDYRLQWNERGELAFTPAKKPGESKINPD